MESTHIIELLSYTLPALITGGVAYYFFNLHTKNEEGRRRYLLQKELQKESLPLRLQAYERMVLFLERINPAKLLIRVAPFSEDKNAYESFLIQQIEQEFEHNLTQQIYLTAETWDIVLKAKNSTIQMIRKNALREDVADADKLREAVMIELTETEAPSNIAISYLKEELKRVF